MIAQVVEAGFQTLRTLKESNSGRQFVFFGGKKYSVVIDEERFSVGEDPGENAMEVYFSFFGDPNPSLPKDTEIVRVGFFEGEAVPFKVITSTYHQGIKQGYLVMENVKETSNVASLDHYSPAQGTGNDLNIPAPRLLIDVGENDILTDDGTPDDYLIID